MVLTGPGKLLFPVNPTPSPAQVFLQLPDGSGCSNPGGLARWEAGIVEKINPIHFPPSSEPARGLPEQVPRRFPQTQIRPHERTIRFQTT